MYCEPALVGALAEQLSKERKRGKSRLPGNSAKESGAAVPQAHDLFFDHSRLFPQPLAISQPFVQKCSITMVSMYPDNSTAAVTVTDVALRGTALARST